MRKGLRTLRDLAPTAGIELTPAIPLCQALCVLRGAGVPAATVLSRGVAVGVVSVAGIEARLAHIGAGVDHGAHCVEEVMTRRIVVMSPDADPASAARVLRDLAIDHVIVMDTRGCLGLLSSAQLSNDDTLVPVDPRPADL